MGGIGGQPITAIQLLGGRQLAAVDGKGEGQGAIVARELDLHQPVVRIARPATGQALLDVGSLLVAPRVQALLNVRQVVQPAFEPCLAFLDVQARLTSAPDHQDANRNRPVAGLEGEGSPDALIRRPISGQGALGAIGQGWAANSAAVTLRSVASIAVPSASGPK